MTKLAKIAYGLLIFGGMALTYAGLEYWGVKIVAGSRSRHKVE